MFQVCICGVTVQRVLFIGEPSSLSKKLHILSLCISACFAFLLFMPQFAVQHVSFNSCYSLTVHLRFVLLVRYGRKLAAKWGVRWMVFYALRYGLYYTLRCVIKFGFRKCSAWNFL